MGDLWLHFYCLAQVYHLESFPFAYTLYILWATSRYYPEFRLCIAFYCTCCCVLGICKLGRNAVQTEGDRSCSRHLLRAYYVSTLGSEGFTCIHLFIPQTSTSGFYCLPPFINTETEIQGRKVICPRSPAQISSIEIQSQVRQIPEHSAAPPLLLGPKVKGNKLDSFPLLNTKLPEKSNCCSLHEQLLKRSKRKGFYYLYW